MAGKKAGVSKVSMLVSELVWGLRPSSPDHDDQRYTQTANERDVKATHLSQKKHDLVHGCCITTSDLETTFLSIVLLGFIVFCMALLSSLAACSFELLTSIEQVVAQHQQKLI